MKRFGLYMFLCSVTGFGSGVMVPHQECCGASGSKTLCKSLLENGQPVPENSLFSEKSFEAACRKLQNKNEARLVLDIFRLIVPSAETLATLGATHLEKLVESVNEGWKNSIPLAGTRSQPDYFVGFRREALTDDQLNKLSPFIGEFMTVTCPFS
jgi:hypothetical protein